MKILRFVIGLIVIAISVYGLTTKDYTYSAFSTLFMGFFFALFGIEELRNNRKKGLGYFFLAVAAFILIMALFSF
ncbi:DUF3953 domain-containing protein [Planomicrobium chinense]|uniref:DUF3953 domain-containing protein n=1 Tax=Planococcus chinensis TaxID=272917 RepID=UPI001CC71F89|nr:DUF3953 domain-containing protein [Planococcus chinensis]MBZ5201402.1 DUF3953 domain-containing protein [Planococcus chinensis]